MKAKCIANNGKSLSKDRIPFINSPNYTREYLEIEKIYTIYGIVILENTISYLISHSLTNSPAFEPAEFFEIVENSIPPSWRYNYFGKSKATLGYKELALEANHAGDLEERENIKAFKTFFIRKNEIDEWEKSRQDY